MLNSDESIIEFDTSCIVSKTAFNFFRELFLSNIIVLAFLSFSSLITFSCFKIFIWIKSYVFVFLIAYLYVFVFVFIVLSILV